MSMEVSVSAVMLLDLRVPVNLVTMGWRTDRGQRDVGGQGHLVTQGGQCTEKFGEPEQTQLQELVTLGLFEQFSFKNKMVKLL